MSAGNEISGSGTTFTLPKLYMDTRVRKRLLNFENEWSNRSTGVERGNGQGP